MHIVWSVLLLSAVFGCSGQSSKAISVLAAPAGTKPTVATQLEQGNASSHRATMRALNRPSGRLLPSMRPQPRHITIWR